MTRIARLVLLAVLVFALQGASPSVARADAPPQETSPQPQGIRVLQGKHLTLYTDLPAEPSVDELPAVFDQAFPVWCEYFGVDATKHDSWRATAYLMKDRARFEAAGKYPRTLPEFANGYCTGESFWLYDFNNPYYRRHLLLHEGTHSFMFTLLKANGPMWYMEGLAEMFGTHRWQAGKLTTPYFPRHPRETPGLGRIELVRRDLKKRKGKSLDTLMNTQQQDYAQNEAYSWSWAAVTMMANHPRYREAFRTAYKHLNGAAEFNEHIRKTLGANAAQWNEDWQAFVVDLDYGYDFERTTLDYQPGKPLAGSHKLTIAADSSWQNTGLRVEAGRPVQITARGEFRVAREPELWTSHPEGISLDYYRGRPLGQLVAVVRPDEDPLRGGSRFLRPEGIGAKGQFTPERSGTLYLRVNESPAHLKDNSGQIDVTVSQP